MEPVLFACDKTLINWKHQENKENLLCSNFHEGQNSYAFEKINTHHFFSVNTLKALNFVGTKFRSFRVFWGLPQNFSF